MAPFEVLYGRQCCTPLSWIEFGEKTIFGPDLITGAEAAVSRIQDNLRPTPGRATHDGKKNLGCWFTKKGPLGFELSLATPPPTAVSTAFPMWCASSNCYATEHMLNHANSDTIYFVWRNSTAHGGFELSHPKISNFGM
jgi:hypothetical protein